MVDKVDVANRSLRLVGGARIASFTDGSKNANVVRDVYDELLAGELAFPWGFAKTRQKLAKNSIAPGFGFDFAYSLPSDWIFTVSVHDNDAGFGTIIYKEEQINNKNVLVSNSDAIYLRYTKLETDVNRWTSSFTTGIVYLLAGEVAVGVSGSETLADKRAAQGRRFINRARGVSAQGSTPEPRNRGSWVNSRKGWR
ncbi:hypothetical protein KAR91_44800 [Candidatus Pacearchaeota archaeon]|nr:hypothetical protein [Candidatus Pacearchaeota archaeon]